MPVRRSPNGARHVRPPPGRNRPERVVAINRNAWSQSVGTGGRNHPVRANKHEDIAKALKARLSELTGRVAEIDSELRKPLSADSEDRATDLDNQDALEGIENSENQEIQQIGEALKRIAEGIYGVCTQCGADIDPKRLKALPNATR